MNLEKMNWKDQDAKRLTIELSKHLERAKQSNLTPQFTNTFLIVADMYPQDKESILSVLRPVKTQTVSRQTMRDASHMVSSPLASLKGAVPTPTRPTPANDAECDWCPGSLKKSPALKKLEQIKATEEEPPLPAELFENEPPPPKKEPLKRETTDFTMGETVEEVLFAHGYGADGVDDKAVKERLLATLQIVDNVDIDRRWNIRKLAAAILESKGIEPI